MKDDKKFIFLAISCQQINIINKNFEDITTSLFIYLYFYHLKNCLECSPIERGHV